MMNMLGLCTSCRRFARGANCPFCGGAVRASHYPHVGHASRGMLALATAALAACGSSSPPPGGPSANDAGYGGPPMVYPDAPPAQDATADVAEASSDADVKGD
jgi:hypothetical protein